MKHLFFIALLLTATLTYAQGLLPEEKIRKEPPAQPVQQPAKQPVHQTKKYDWKGEYYEGLAKVKLNDKYGFIDKTGKEVIPIKYDNAEFFSEGLALVKLNNKYGFIDKAGKEVIPIKYDDAYSFSEGLAKVKLNNKYGFIDKTGKEVIPIKYDDAYSFSKISSLALVKLEGKWFYINQKGECVKDCNNAPSDHPIAK